MDNTERSDSFCVNTEEVENPNFIKNSGEAVPASSSLPPQRKRPLNNPSGHESDGCTSKRFKIVSEEEEFRWSLPADTVEYANKNSEKFIPDKDVKEAILLKFPRPENIDPVKKLDEFLLELLKQKKITVDIKIDDTFEKVQGKVTDIMGPLSKLWDMIENASSEKDGNAPVVQMDTILELLEKNVVLIGQCSNAITYERHKNALLGVTGTSTTQVAAMLKEIASFLQKYDMALFGKEFTDNFTETIKAKKQSIEAITEVSRPNNRQPFRSGPAQNKMSGWQRQYHNKGYKQGNGKMLFFERNSSFPQHITSKSNTTKHGGFDSCFSNSKTLIFINDLTNLLSGRKVKTFSTCLDFTYKRSKYLVLSRRVQDPSATRTEANVFSKTSIMEKRSEKTDRLGNERDLGEGSDLQSFTSRRRISQSNISGREKGWEKQASNQSKKPQRISAFPAFQNGGFTLPKICITEGRLHVQSRFKMCIFQSAAKQGVPEISKISMGRKHVRVPLPLFWTTILVIIFWNFTIF